MHIRTLTDRDVAAYCTLRSEMLADAPTAFSSSPEDDRGLDPAFIAARLADPFAAIIGAFDGGGRLVGSAGIVRKTSRKMAHRVHVWGVYVTPASRGAGVARRIMLHAIEVARSWPGVDSLDLSAGIGSAAARKLYESLGFRAWGIEPAALRVHGRDHDEVHMVLILPRS